jgi:tRNA threonylcarbamoyladenosine biosynthesis protein TsaE
MAILLNREQYLCSLNMQLTYTLQTINEAAKHFWKIAGNAKVFALHGTMGTGKTTLVHALCEVRGVNDVVGSPTFSLINEYRDAAGKTIYHLDLYRLETEEEAIRAGVEDCLYSGEICLVEWPEKAEHLFPDDTVHVKIELVDDKTRKLVFNG